MIIEFMGSPARRAFCRCVYTEQLLESKAAKTMRSPHFLDLFNHRLVSLFLSRLGETPARSALRDGGNTEA
jgi:predicted component of type VI protein secretion system